jgi:hypothetical protein
MKVISWWVRGGPLYEPFMAGEGLYYTRAGSKLGGRGANVDGAQLMPVAPPKNPRCPILGVGMPHTRPGGTL